MGEDLWEEDWRIGGIGSSGCGRMVIQYRIGSGRQRTKVQKNKRKRRPSKSAEFHLSACRGGVVIGNIKAMNKQMDSRNGRTRFGSAGLVFTW